MVLNGGGGNDTFVLPLSPAARPDGLVLNGGAGSNVLTVSDLAGGAVLRNAPTGPGRGFLYVRYLSEALSTISYQNIARVLGALDDPTNYLESLFHHIFGRNAHPLELASWKPFLATSGRLAVVRALELTAESRTSLVRRWFQLFLGRAPSAREAAPFVQALLAGQSEEAVLGRLLGSPSASRTARVRGALVDFEFQDLFGRKPTPAERNALVNSFNGLAALRMLIEASPQLVSG
jgi:hypothetical protein